MSDTYAFGTRDEAVQFAHLMRRQERKRCVVDKRTSNDGRQFYAVEVYA